MVAGKGAIGHKGRLPGGSMDHQRIRVWAEASSVPRESPWRSVGGREEPQPMPIPRPEPAPPDPDPRPPMPKPPASLVLAALEHGSPSVVAIIPSA